MIYEYKVIPAPTKGVKAKGVKGAPDRFANALQTAMNVLAADRWEYLRAETLPAEEREGLMGKTTVFQNMLVFRRLKETTGDKIAGVVAAPEDVDLDAAQETAPETEAPSEPEIATDPAMEESEPAAVEDINASEQAEKPA